jgi:hypothetical protein
MLGVKVDLVEKRTLKPRIGKHVLEEVVNVWQGSNNSTMDEAAGTITLMVSDAR